MEAGVARGGAKWYYLYCVGNTEVAMSTTVTRKGQVTIPKAVRDRLGIVAGSSVRFELAPDGCVVLLKDGDTLPRSRFARLLGAAGPGLSTDEVMALTRGPYDDVSGA